MSIEDKIARLDHTKRSLRSVIDAMRTISPDLQPIGGDTPFGEYPDRLRDVLTSQTPDMLFDGNVEGAWYDPSDMSTMFQDSEGTTPVTEPGQPVGLMLDKSGNDNHLIQAVSSYRPIYRIDGNVNWLEFDGIDDILETVTETTPATGCFIFLSGKAGLGSGSAGLPTFGWNVTAGATAVDSVTIKIRPNELGTTSHEFGARSMEGDIHNHTFVPTLNKGIPFVVFGTAADSPLRLSTKYGRNEISERVSATTFDELGFPRKIGVHGANQPFDFFGGVAVGNANTIDRLPVAMINLITEFLSNKIGI